MSDDRQDFSECPRLRVKCERGTSKLNLYTSLILSILSGFVIGVTSYRGCKYIPHSLSLSHCLCCLCGVPLRRSSLSNSRTNNTQKNDDVLAAGQHLNLLLASDYQPNTVLAQTTRGQNTQADTSLR